MTRILKYVPISQIELHYCQGWFISRMTERCKAKPMQAVQP